MGTSVSTGLLTASAVIFQGRGMLNAVEAIADGTNAMTMNVFDGLDNTGKLLVRADVAAGAVTPDTGASIQTPVRFTTGLFVELVGTGAPSGLVHWGGM
jgi:hypothetical protein